MRDMFLVEPLPFEFLIESVRDLEKRINQSKRMRNIAFLKTEWPDFHDPASKAESLDDLMRTLVFLCSSDSDFMTGKAIAVDGGSVFQ